MYILVPRVGKAARPRAMQRGTCGFDDVLGKEASIDVRT
jgi:hypothetical protein